MKLKALNPNTGAQHIMDWAVDLVTVPATNITPLSNLVDQTYQVG